MRMLLYSITTLNIKNNNQEHSNDGFNTLNYDFKHKTLKLYKEYSDDITYIDWQFYTK